MQLRRVTVDAERARPTELIFSITPAQQTDAQHAGSPGGQQVPHGVSHNITLCTPEPQALLASEEEVRLGLGAQYISPLDHNRLLTHAEGVERRVDLRPLS